MYKTVYLQKLIFKITILQTAERVSDQDLSDNFVYQRSVLAYFEASKLVSGNVLEIGFGEGYGMRVLSPKVANYTAIDKHYKDFKDLPSNVKIINQQVPPLSMFADESFDFVVSFQVIVHIKNDKFFVKEISRVLKKGGKFIVTTPNIKMSLTRNPWHIREYKLDELKNLLSKDFSEIDCKGVLGNEKVSAYYLENKKSVQRIMRFDIFRMQYWLPRWILQIPYDIMNRRNRKKLLTQNTSLVADIKMDDYFVDSATDNCFDWFFVAKK